ncbi:MAG: four helix bundle protein [Balneolales bacterium]
MERTNFEKLEVYQLAEKLSDNIWNMVIKWDYLAKNTVGSQIIRSADSIGANIAEGLGRGTVNDHKRFIRIARGSLNETKHWLRRAYKRKLVTSKEIDIFKPLLTELPPRLNAYLNSIGKIKSTTVSTANVQPTTHNQQQ